MKIKFSPNQYDFLKTNLIMDDDMLFNVFEDSKIGDFLFDLNEDIMCDIRDWAGEKLQMVGFDENYDVTEKGQILEDIIDILYI